MAMALATYLERDKELNNFVNQISKNTGEFYEDLWLENARANRPLIRKCGWACEGLQDAYKGKTTVLLGASAAIEKQFEQLRELQDDPDFVFIGIGSGLENLLKNGIKPKYVMIADADPKINRFWTELDFEQTRDITLISNICTAPKVLEKWRGDIKFLAIWTTIKKLDKKFRKWFDPINGSGDFFHGLMSQYNTGFAVGFLVFNCPVAIFVGNELGFKSKDHGYYPDRKDIKDNWYKGKHIDVNGDIYYTNYGLMSLKLILEDYLEQLWGAGWFLNCTECGIFGVSERWKRKTGSYYLPWIQPLKLKTGIAQARMIMRTGQPLYMA